MALDRQSIEKRDFPIGRRGYEPEAVDEHLAQLADQIETLQRQAQRRSGASLAQAASEQVRAIVEAAEQSAAAIERDAEAEAAQIRASAERDAERIDAEAVERSQEHVGAVSQQTQLMLQRVDAMESELGALLDALRTGANRLNADLALLQSNMADLYGAAGGRPEDVASAPAPAPVRRRAAAPDPEAGMEDLEPAAEEEAEPAAPPEPEPAPVPKRGGSGARAATPPDGAQDEGEDVEGARLIALNMALNGQSREETDRYLAENFDLDDREALLDEVYASVGG